MWHRHFPHSGARYARTTSPAKAGEERWVARDQLASTALPTVMRKILEHGLDEGRPLFAQVERRGR